MSTAAITPRSHPDQLAINSGHAPDQALCREAVLDLRALPQRRRFPVSLHVGRPGHALTYPAEVAYDFADRVELLAGAVDALASAAHLVWLTRPGELEIQTDDLAWLAATRHVAAEVSLSLPFVVVTKQGWRDPGSGCSRQWRRLRQR